MIQFMMAESNCQHTLWINTELRKGKVETYIMP